MSGDARSVVVRVSMDVANAIRNSQQFGKSVVAAAAEAEKGTIRADRALQNLGDSAGKVGLGAAAGVAFVTKSAMDWETAWAGVTKTTSGTAAQMDELEQGIRGLAKTMPATHAEIAGVAEAAGQLGVKREEIVDFTKVMVELGESTNLSAEEAATSIAQMANVMGTAPDDIDNLGAALVALGNNGASTERQIVEMAQRISGAGAIVGLTEADVLGIANAVASVGVEVEAGGTAISTVLAKLASATKNGGAELETFAETAHMSSAEFVQAFERDPAQAFSSFVKGLNDIDASGGNVFATLKDLHLSDVRVTSTLLRMAKSGDLLSDSLQQGSAAWAENTALTAEYGKRVETTASQVKVSWNNIKDASIDAGADMLPIVEHAADAVGGLAKSFGILPQPVKSTVGGLLGITAVLGGGLWFTAKAVNSVNTMRESLETLGVSAGRTKAVMATLGKASVIIATAQALNDLQVSLRQTADVNLSNLSEDLQIFGSTGKASGELIKQFGSDLNGAAKTMHADGSSLGETLAYAAEGAGSFIEKLEGYDSSEAVTQTKQLDEALAALAGTDAPAAAAAFGRLTDAAKDQGVSQKELLKVFPEYASEVARLKAQAEGAAGAQGTLTDATKQQSAAAQAATAMSEAQAAALKQQRDAARETARSFVNLGASLNDSKVSLNSWIADLEKQRQALIDFQHNARTAARRGLNEGLIASLQEAGSEGALRMGQLAHATKDQLADANRAWRGGQRAIRDYVNFKVPVKKPKVDTKQPTAATRSIMNKMTQLDRLHAFPKVTVDKGPAESSIRSIQSLIDQLHGTTVPIKVGKLTYNPVPTIAPKAHGGFHPDVRFFSDGGDIANGHQPQMASAGTWRVWAEPETGGETYIPHANDSRRPMAKQYLEQTANMFGGRVEWYANGGRRGSDVDGVHELGKAAKEAAKHMRDAAKAERDRVASLKQNLTSGVGDKFRSNIFETDNVWAAGGDWASRLKADAAAASKFTQDTRLLKKKGLTGGALDYLLTNADPSMVHGFAGMTKDQLAQYGHLYRARERAATAAGRTAGTAAYGAHLTRIERELKKLNAKVEKNAEKTGHAVGKQVNGAARAGARRGARAGGN